LKKDSADIDRALEDFLEARNAASQLQKDALEVYEQEMAEIAELGDMNMIENEMGESFAIDNDEAIRNVDHNINRLLNKQGDVPTGDGEDDEDNYDDDYDDEEFDTSGNVKTNFTIRGREKTTKKKKTPEVFIRRAIPAPEVKKEMRSKLFGMLSQQRMDEEELEDEITSLKAKSNPNEMLIQEVSDLLFSKQKDHYERIADFVNDYQPHTSGKAWGGDPEYIKLMKEMRKRFDRKTGSLSL